MQKEEVKQDVKYIVTDVSNVPKKYQSVCSYMIDKDFDYSDINSSLDSIYMIVNKEKYNN